MPDNTNNLISPEDIRDIVDSVHNYAELYMSATGTQEPGTTYTELTFDMEGESYGIGVTGNAFDILTDGRYQIDFIASVEMQNGRTFDIQVAVDGSNVAPLAMHEDGDDKVRAIIGSRILDLTNGQSVTLRIEASGNNSDFYMQEGSVFRIKYLL